MIDLEDLFQDREDLYDEDASSPGCRRCNKHCTWMQQTGKWVLGDYVGTRLRLHVCDHTDAFEDLT
jgi:hypothetical protein